MIDLHTHVLPGIDDGPATIEGSVALARAALASGTSVLVATPHASWRYPNEAGTIARAVEQLRARLTAEEVAVELRAGAEIAITHVLDIAPERLSSLGLNGGPWLLVEPPFTASATGLDTALMNIQAGGHRILLAHPERCPAFHGDPRMLESLVRAGILTSITAGSLTGRFGSTVRRFALELADAEMIHNVASDAHDDTRRPPGMASQLKQAGLGALAGWLTEDVPEAILNGEEVPRRPPFAARPIAPRRRQWWRRRG